MIPGVKLTPLKLIPDSRGWLLECLRRDARDFTTFGQAYISATYPGVVKAWHRHRKQTDHFICVAGMVKVVCHLGVIPEGGVVLPGGLFSETQEFFLGPLNPQRLTIPPGVYHGWQCLSPEPALVLNLPTEPYDYAHPDEERVPAHGVLPYDWLARPDR